MNEEKNLHNTRRHSHLKVNNKHVQKNKVVASSKDGEGVDKQAQFQRQQLPAKKDIFI